MGVGCFRGCRCDQPWGGRPVADVLQDLGFGLGHVIQIIVGGGIYFADCVQLVIMNPITKQVKKDFNLDNFDAALTVSIVFVGILIGNVASGPIGDSCGRRTPILQSYLGLFISSLVMSYAFDFETLLLARFLMGYFIGLGIPAWNALSSELASPEWRMYSNTASQINFALGGAFGALLIEYQDPFMKDLQWRALTMQGAVPALFLFIVGYFTIYESPLVLALHGEHAEARQVLSSLRYRNGVDENVGVDVIAPGNPEEVRSKTFCETMYDGMSIMFGRYLRYTTMVLAFSAFACNVLYWGGGMYAFAAILPELQLLGSPAQNFLLLSIIEGPAAIFAIALDSCVSRKSAVMFSYFGILVATAVFAWGVEVKGKHPHASAALQIGMLTFRFFASMAFSLVYIFATEVYPTLTRSMGSSFVISTGRFGSILAPILYEVLMEHSSFNAFAAIMMGICLVNMLLVYSLPFDPKGLVLADFEEEIKELTDDKPRGGYCCAGEKPKEGYCCLA
eukprot:TRINITY_DN115575_c0_g1_i1.p1 TRINITY_DN115575_c0_g1~~TRINITY_DN115575_c0_g1_i1.p1  ORF type:complete len:508 (+),score=56.12 TRINITY_DN115575_c0_g1_i1:122-1645(+)